MKKLLRVLVIAALLVAIAIPCLADGSASTDPSADPTPVPFCKGAHSWDDGEITQKPTCTEDGVKTITCKKCPKSYTTSVPATGHKFGEWEDVKAATCNEDGKQVRKCQNDGCDKEETRTIAATGKHEPVDSKKTQAPTCINPGRKAVKECKNCHTVLEWEDDPNQPATGICTKFKTETKAATCSEEGYTAKVCAVCGKEQSRTTIEKKAHTWGSEVEKSAATCTEAQVLVKYCKVCGAESDPEKGTAALKHDWTKWEVTKAATCTEAGEQARTCNRCNITETKPIAALNHKKTKTVVVDPTCAAEGAINTVCTYCNTVLKSEPIKKLDHTFEWKVTKEAKPCLNGEETQICKKCGAEGETRVIKATEAHKFSTEAKVVKAPTCTEEGLKDKVCTVCGTAEGKGEKIPALGHKPGEYTETKAATCTEKGEEVSKCTVCNAVVDTREVAAKGHTAGEWITVRQPSASQNGKMIQKCTVCGAQIGKKYIRATGTADTAVKTVAYVAGAEVANYAKIDLTVDGTTELDLVSANGTKVGKLVVEVKEGKVTVKYELSAVPADAFLTFVAEAPAKDVHAEKEFEFEKAISVADELAGAAAAYIYVEIEY